MAKWWINLSKIPSYSIIGIVVLYQKGISPYTRPSCRFNPSCSHYAISAFKKFGFFRGSLIACWRILRCNPFCRGGEDPVPEQVKLFPKRRNMDNEITCTDENHDRHHDLCHHKFCRFGKK